MANCFKCNMPLPKMVYEPNVTYCGGHYESTEISSLRASVKELSADLSAALQREYRLKKGDQDYQRALLDKDGAIYDLRQQLKEFIREGDENWFKCPYRCKNGVVTDYSREFPLRLWPCPLHRPDHVNKRLWFESPKRYKIDWSTQEHFEDPDGPYVLFEDVRTDHGYAENLNIIDNLKDELAELRAALENMVAHEVDYMKRNNLGDPEKQSYVIQARAALAAKEPPHD